MAKRNSCEMAAEVARNARQMLGGMGITGEFFGDAPFDESRNRNDLRGYTRYSPFDYRARHHRNQRISIIFYSLTT
jgi:alkylation response protein AidB-like acyl-CoA dehydrogenase